jgi:hypothetical protein
MSEERDMDPASPSKPLAKRRSSAGLGGAFFFFYPIRSEYQIERINRPNIFAVIKVEVVWNEGQHFGTVSKKLDKFSTFDGFAVELNAEAFRAAAGTSRVA